MMLASSLTSLLWILLKLIKSLSVIFDCFFVVVVICLYFSFYVCFVLFFECLDLCMYVYK